MVLIKVKLKYNRKPKISVIIPAYNAQNTIEATVESVLNQAFKDFELIIIDDGSTDLTVPIISRIQDPLFRVKLYSYPHANANIARNRGFNHSNGEYISFLDADDLWNSDKLELQLKALENNPKSLIAYSWTDYIDESGERLQSGTHISRNGNIYEALLRLNFIENGSNILVKREAFIECNGFDPTIEAAQDWDINLRLALKFEYACVESVGILYRQSSQSYSSQLWKQARSCIFLIKREQSRHRIQNKIPRTVFLESYSNIYKYLICKAFLPPITRHKALIAAWFLLKFILIPNVHRLKKKEFASTMALKIGLSFVSPKIWEFLKRVKDRIVESDRNDLFKVFK